uniref:Retrovirus-related Pol polyprotein from transposon TNT 1-94 n=1 Tax=Tanacetum cinerariifolium TaxID=118510 RepID=A0A6L2MXV3_TANCI|nr:retrovirus-related Pol polyprotein from transposon TNT 1-94 [Tanacetum cinerariifolium]
MTEGNKKQYIADVKVMSYLLQAIPNDIYNSVDACKNAKKMWERIKRLMFGSDVTSHVRHSRLMDEFNKFAAKEGESLESVYERLTTLVNIMNRYFREQMLLAMNDEARSNLNNEENDFMLDTSYGEETMEELTAAVMLMARIQPVDGNVETVPSYDAKAVSEKVDGKSSKDNILQNEIDRLLEVSLTSEIRNCALLSVEKQKNELLKDELAKSSSDSKDIQANLLKRIKILENDFKRSQAQTIDFELKLQHQKEKMACDVSLKSKLSTLNDENVLLKTQVEYVVQERENIKLEFQKLFDSIKATRTQHQKEVDELIEHVNQKTHAYADVRAQNQDLLVTISELKDKLMTNEKGKHVNTKFDKSKTLGKLVCVTPFYKNLRNKAKNVSNTKVKTDRNSNVKRALFTIPVAAKSKNLEATSIVRMLEAYECNLQLLKNFVEKFMGTVNFGNDHFTTITGYEDYVQGNLTICHVYYVEGLRHNLFSVRQFCDGNLEVAFRSNACYVWNLEGDDLLTSSRDSNLYTICISDMAASSPVCLMSRATSTKFWLWHRRLSHLNFGTINQLTSKDLVDGLLKFKYNKDHLCLACEQGKSKKASLPSKLVPSIESKLELLHMDLYRPMRVASINGKKYILVIVDDYSRFTWIYFLRTKD